MCACVCVCVHVCVLVRVCAGGRDIEEGTGVSDGTWTERAWFPDAYDDCAYIFLDIYKCT